MYALTTPLRRAATEDNQCQAVLRNGKKCPFQAEDESDFCSRHRQNAQHRYAIAAELPQIPAGALLDLTAEVDLLKRLIGARAALLKDSDSIILYSGHIADLITRAQKLVDGAVKLEQAKGNLLPRATAMALIGNIINIVADVVQDVDVLDEIHERIEALLLEQTTPEQGNVACLR